MKHTRTIYISDEVWSMLKQLADKDNRPISNYLETVLIKYLTDRERE